MLIIRKKRHILLIIITLFAFTPLAIWATAQISESFSTYAADPYNYMLTFNANGGIMPNSSGWEVNPNNPAEAAVATYDTGDTCPLTIPNAAPTRTGYTFLGWADSPTATTAKYNKGGVITLTKTDSHKTIYAVWEENSTTGPSISGSTDRYTYGSSDGIIFTPTTPKTPSSVSIDNNNLSSSDYTVNSSTGAVTVKPSYLDSLTDGNHTVAVTWNDGTTSSTTFTTTGNTSDGGDEHDGGDSKDGDDSKDGNDSKDEDEDNEANDEEYIDEEDIDNENVAVGSPVAVPDTGSSTKNNSNDNSTVPVTSFIAIFTLIAIKLLRHRRKIDFKK